MVALPARTAKVSLQKVHSLHQKVNTTEGWVRAVSTFLRVTSAFGLSVVSVGLVS